MSLSTKCGRIVITDGLIGIGPTLVRRIVEQGGSAIYNGLLSEEYQISDAGALAHAESRVTHVPLLLTQEWDVEQLFRVAISKLVDIDGVAVNVSLPECLVRVADLPLDTWQNTLHTGLNLPFWIAKAAIGEFLAGGSSGRLVFVVEQPGVAGSNAAQASVVTALQGLSRSIAKEYGSRGITSNVVIWDRSCIPPVETILFLLGEGASFISGELFTVYGS
jgi:3-oxoacyl-[acyl-carrier protein] reductase